MAVRASSTTRGAFGGMTSLYFEDDRVEVGTTNIICYEELRRIAYRDVRRIVSWPDTQRPYRFAGMFFLVLTLLGAALAILFASNGTDDGVATGIALGVGAVVLGTLTAMLLYAGRTHGITHLRIEGVRGTLEATLGGSAKKRTRVLEELERRVARRQSAR